MTFPDDIARAVAAIHAAPPRLVYVFAGAGGLALYWLHAVAGSSRTLLEARDCYAPRSLAEVAGGAPAQAAGAATAHAMAVWAHARAAELAEGPWPLLGVSCTAAIATDRERRGADRAYVAVWDGRAPAAYALSLLKTTPRLAQEDLVSRLVIDAVARACEV
ncbi:MAG TPA: hypothetical protein PKD53_21750 [Chloroflexaceae bacterium]|nr:hypothetical protein [Chloroflexaceae bacterium]